MKHHDNHIRNALIGLTLAVITVVAVSFSAHNENSSLEGRLRSTARSTKTVRTVSQNRAPKTITQNKRSEKAIREVRSIETNRQNNEPKTIVDTRGNKVLKTHHTNTGITNPGHVTNNGGINNVTTPPQTTNNINTPLPDLVIENVQIHPGNVVKAKVSNIGNADVVLENVVQNMLISRPGVNGGDNWTTYFTPPLSAGQSQYVEIYNSNEVQSGALNLNSNLEVCIDL